MLGASRCSWRVVLTPRCAAPLPYTAPSCTAALECCLTSGLTLCPPSFWPQGRERDFYWLKKQALLPWEPHLRDMRVCGRVGVCAGGYSGCLCARIVCWLRGPVVCWSCSGFKAFLCWL